MEAAAAAGEGSGSSGGSSSDGGRASGGGATAEGGAGWRETPIGWLRRESRPLGEQTNHRPAPNGIATP